MKEIIEKWCRNEQLSIEEVASILTEYMSITGRQISGEEIMILLQLGNQIPINWWMIIGTICNNKGWNLARIQSSPDERGNIRIVRYYIYE